MGGGIQFTSLSADAEFILQCKYGAGDAGSAYIELCAQRNH